MKPNAVKKPLIFHGGLMAFSKEINGIVMEISWYNNDNFMVS